MKTLTEHNMSSRCIVYFHRPGDPTGVLCDVCDHELLYVSGTPVCSNPPKTDVFCPSCGTLGTKVGAGEDECLQLIAEDGYGD